MARDPARVDAELVASVLARAGSADEAEVRAALATLTPTEERRLERLLGTPPPGHLGPSGWADVARGTDPQLAAARELSGYYTLLAERDALAAMVSAPKPRARAAKAPTPARAKAPTSARRPAPARAKKQAAPRSDRAQHLLGLFAYHRDIPSVARTLELSLEELDAELESLGIRRQAYRIARGSDALMPVAKAVAGPGSPPVRRRSARSPPPDPAPIEGPGTAPEQHTLKTLLAELGPRRGPLADRLGVAGNALLARFRAAGLERELAFRERDLIRALWSKHRGSQTRVAAELDTTVQALREIAVERGIARELESLRDRFRREALRRRWPRDRIEQVLHRRDELRELGVLEGLEREVAVRAGVIWTSLQGKRDALELFAKKLHLTKDDAVRLQKLLNLS